MKKKFPFVTLKIKLKTAEEFKKYSRQLGTQHTETLQIMLDFFETNRFTLFESLGSNLSGLEKKIKMRINTVVAILKDIEKTQTKPTHAMIQLLFQEKPLKKDILLEKKPLQKEESYSPNDLILNSDPSIELERKLTSTKKELYALLKKVKVTHNNFGKENIQLKISQEELENIKTKLKNL